MQSFVAFSDVGHQGVISMERQCLAPENAVVCVCARTHVCQRLGATHYVPISLASIYLKEC